MADEDLTFWQKVEKGATNVLNPLAEALGFTHHKADAAQANLQAKLAAMSEAYKQYRGFAADTRQRQLNSALQLHQPQEQYMQYLLPSYHSTTNQAAQGFGDTVAGIHAQIGDGPMPVGQSGGAWPVASGDSGTGDGPGAVAGFGGSPNNKRATQQIMDLMGQMQAAKPQRPTDPINNVTGPTLGRV